MWLVHTHKAQKKLQAPTERPEFWMRVLNRATLAAGIIGPLTDIPQILKILSTQNATGVSALAWGATAILDIPFLIYGIVHKDKAISITYTLWLIGNILVVVTTLIYS
jgi:uncharacterized protein with PQ loop repeat